MVSTNHLLSYQVKFYVFFVALRYGQYWDLGSLSGENKTLSIRCYKAYNFRQVSWIILLSAPVYCNQKFGMGNWSFFLGVCKSLWRIWFRWRIERFLSSKTVLKQGIDFFFPGDGIFPFIISFLPNQVQCKQMTVLRIGI